MHRYNSARQVVDHFKDSTLIHAMPHTKNAPLGSFRKVWGFIFVIGVVGLSYQFYLAFTNYYSYPIQVQILMQTSRSLMFPSVTICNNNPVKRSKIRCSTMDDIIQVQDKMDMKLHKTRIQAFKKPRSNTVLPSVIIDPFATDYTCNKETANEVPNPQIEENSSCSCTTTFSSTTINPETLSSVNASSIETTDILSTSNSSNSLNNSNISTISPLSDLREKRAAIFTGNIATPLSESYIISAMANGQVNPNSNSFYRDLLRFVQSAVPDLSNLLEMSSVPEETVRDYGYAAEDFIMECSWDSTKCSYEDFHQFYNRRYGNCFTFNAGLNKNPQNATRWGSVYGLRLTLNTNISQYLGLLAQDSGVRIAFHQPGTFAFPEMTGMSAPPGFLTTVALSMMKIQRLPSPYPNHCQSDYPAKYIQFLPPKTTYTQLSCQVACIQSVLFKECGCVDKLPLNGTYPQCSIRDDNAQKCWLNVVKRQYLPASDVEAIICDCTPACDEVQYITSVSQSQWPSPAYQMLKINNFLVDDPLAAFFLGKYNISGNPDRFNVKEWVPDISVENNLIRFQAYYQDLNYQSLWEQASYPIERLFTDIGGIFGLYLGMSLAALFEVVELLVMLLMVAFGKTKSSNLVKFANPKSNMANDIIAYPAVQF